jgi:hypothetical protein
MLQGLEYEFLIYFLQLIKTKILFQLNLKI